MTSANLPAHSHQVDLQGSLLMPTGNSADTDDPSGAYPGQSSQNIYSTNKSTAAMANMEGQLSVQLQNNGGQQPIDNYQPSLVMHYIIALQGIFPSRS